MILIWQFGECVKIAKLTYAMHYQSIYTISMGFSPYSIEIRQFKILPTALFEQTAKYNFRQYFCLYSIWFPKNAPKQTILQ